MLRSCAKKEIGENNVGKLKMIVWHSVSIREEHEAIKSGESKLL